MGLIFKIINKLFTKSMKTTEVESLSIALNDEKIQLKHLTVEDYMKTLTLNKHIKTFLEDQVFFVQSLVKEYNKDFEEKVKSCEFKEALKKKENKEELTNEEKTLLSIKPVVIQDKGMLFGPSDFIEKINKKREQVLEELELNFISDSKVFKSVIENLSTEKVGILYEFLFKK